MKQLFPGTSNDGLDLLSRLLTFDVDKRVTVIDALNHNYFTEVRDKEHERFHKPVHFQFESAQLSTRKLRGLYCIAYSLFLSLVLFLFYFIWFFWL